MDITTDTKHLIEKVHEIYGKFYKFQANERRKRVIECLLEGSVSANPGTEFYGMSRENLTKELEKIKEFDDAYSAEQEKGSETWWLSPKWEAARNLFDNCKFMDQILQIVADATLRNPFGDDKRLELRKASERAMKAETATQASSALRNILCEYRVTLEKYGTITIDRNVILNKIDISINKSNENLKKTSKLEEFVKQVAHERKAEQLTQSVVATDFGVSIRTVKRWEKAASSDNKWHYAKEMRTDPKQRGCYDRLAGTAMLYARYKARFKKEGRIWRISVTSFKDKLDSINILSNNAPITEESIYNEIVDWHNSEAQNLRAMSKARLGGDENTTYANLATNSSLGRAIYEGKMSPRR